MTLLGGLHDREAGRVVPEGGWVLDTVALKDNPPGANYLELGPNRKWITRLNFGYHPHGTIPVKEYYALFAERCALYVAQSKGCSRWIIGNEPNLSIERPNGVPIFPWDYAACYDLCRTAIRAVPGHEQDEVLVAAPGPWNNETSYQSNRNGDWIRYFTDVISAIGIGIDGYAIHSYTHGYDVSLVTSGVKMNAPFDKRHYEFPAYQDFINAIPESVAHKPIYLTEANGNGKWEVVGLIPAMLEEISRWNRTSPRKVSAVIFYRYVCHDHFCMQDKSGVMDEFQDAMRRSYTAEATTKAYVPIVEKPASTPPLPPPPPDIQWDADLTQRGVTLEKATPQPGQKYFALVEGDYMDEQESQGRHHIFVDVVDEQNNRLTGQKVVVEWDGGSASLTTESKPGERAAANFPMYAAGHGYRVRMESLPSDLARGMGLGSIEQPHMGIHVSYFFKFKVATAAAPKPTEPPKPVEPPSQTIKGWLTHPVKNPALRTISQRYGGREEYYKQFVVGGVPLQGHNGVDFATPEGSEIVAVDKGHVVQVGNDPTGYGTFVRMEHVWGESLYAHLSHVYVTSGSFVATGGMVGLSGNTGNSTGPHLHFGVRIKPFNISDGWGGYVDPLPYLQQNNAAADDLAEGVSPRNAIRLAAAEFKVPFSLLASLAWAESSYRPNIKSSAGAMGMLQIMPATWNEWAPRVNANDPYNTLDSARVGAAYLRWLLDLVKGNRTLAIVAYNWGIGNVLNGVTIPVLVSNYASKVVMGADLLEVWEVK